MCTLSLQDITFLGCGNTWSSMQRELWNEGRPRKEQTWQRYIYVLTQIFALTRMRDSCSLKWWSLILSVAYCGWGVGRQALDAINQFGIVCSSRTRNRCLAKLIESLVKRQTKFLSKELAVLLAIDIFVSGQTLRTSVVVDREHR